MRSSRVFIHPLLKRKESHYKKREIANLKSESLPCSCEVYVLYLNVRGGTSQSTLSFVLRVTFDSLQDDLASKDLVMLVTKGGNRSVLGLIFLLPPDSKMTILFCKTK